MPEAATILFVLTVCAGIFIYAKVQSLDPSKRDPVAELRQLKLQHGWLTEQLERAKRENWDHQMVVRLADQLEAATRKLGKIAPVTTEAADKATRLG